MSEILHVKPSDSCVQNGILVSSVDVPEGCEVVCLDEGIVGIRSLSFRPDGRVRRVILPKSLRDIEQEVFSDLTELTDVRLSAGLAHLAPDVFHGCDYLIRLPVDPDNQTFRNQGGLVCSKDGRTVVLCPPGRIRVRVPKGVAEIEAGAFKDCTRLLSVNLPDSLTRIGDLAFSGCAVLKSVSFPLGLKSVGASAFAGCTGLEEMVLPEGVESAGFSAFAGCTALRRVVLPASLVALEEGAFADCTSLDSIEVAPGNPRYEVAAGVLYEHDGLGGRTLRMCSRRARALRIPADVARISPEAFHSSGGLEEVDPSNPFVALEHGLLLAPDGTSVMKARADIDELALPANVTHVMPHAFAGCTRLTSVTIPEHVRFLGDGAFAGCTSLTSVTISSLEDIRFGEDVFSGSGIKTVTARATDRGDVGSGRAYVTTLEIDRNAKKLDRWALWGCSRLERIVVAEDHPTFCVRDGVLYSKDLKTLLFCPSRITGKLIVPETVEQIAEGAFGWGWDHELEEIVLPRGVRGKVNLKRVRKATFDASCRTHDALGFDAEKTLTQAVVTAGTTRIADWCFHGCRKLESVELPSSVTEVGTCAFAGCRRLTKLTFPASVKSIGDRAFDDCRALKEIVFEGVTAIHAEAFKNCRHLASLTLPEGLAEIGDRAFKGCEELSSIHIPASVERIGACAFCGCGKLTSIDVDPANPHFRTRNGLLCSGDGATVLACPHGLDAAEIPADVTALGDRAFCGCAKLDNLNLPAGVSRIGKGAFDRMKEDVQIQTCSEDVAQLVRDVLDEQARERQARMDEVDRVIDEILNA